MFRKLIGGGQVRVSIVEGARAQELVALEFLDDITLECKDNASGTGHQVRVKKGSVLRLKP
jgi:hypothetical protein